MTVWKSLWWRKMSYNWIIYELNCCCEMIETQCLMNEYLYQRVGWPSVNVSNQLNTGCNHSISCMCIVLFIWLSTILNKSLFIQAQSMCVWEKSLIDTYCLACGWWYKHYRHLVLLSRKTNSVALYANHKVVNCAN